MVECWLFYLLRWGGWINFFVWNKFPFWMNYYCLNFYSENCFKFLKNSKNFPYKKLNKSPNWDKNHNFFVSTMRKNIVYRMALVCITIDDTFCENKNQKRDEKYSFFYYFIFSIFCVLFFWLQRWSLLWRCFLSPHK